LNTGENTVTITVTAQDGSENVYTLTIIRHFSSNADLASLVISTGKLIPSFSSAISAYYVSVGNREQGISVIPASSDSRATIAVRINQNPPSPVTSGKSSSELPIAVGENTLEIIVTAEDGGTRTYGIIVERATLQPPSNIAVSKNKPGMVVLSWNAAADADQYHISRSTAPDDGFTELASSAGLSYSDISAIPGVVYYYRIRSWNSLTGSSPASASCEGYRTVSSPASVNASDGLADRITVTWESVSGAQCYEIYKALAADGTYSKVPAEITGTAFNDFQCMPGILYSYKIKAKGADMTGDFSVSDSGYRDIADPANLRATDDIRNREIRLSWSPVEGANLYFVYRSVSSMDGYIQIGSSTISEYKDAGIDFHTTYYYKIRAYAESAAIYSDYSSQDSGYCYLASPSGVNATDTLVDKIKITWGPVPGAERYTILRATSNPVNPVSYISLFDTMATEYDDTSAIPGVVYYYMVVSVAGNSSTCGNFDQGKRLFAAPSDVGASDGYRQRVVIKWSPVSGASTYSVYRSSSSSSGFKIYASVITSSYTDIYVSIGNDYYYTVTASNNGDGESVHSPSVLGICGSNVDAPDNVKASDGFFTDKITISWNKVNDSVVIVGYDIWRADSVSGPYSLIGSTAELWYDDMSVPPGIKYYKVRTCCSKYSSRWSIYDTGYMGPK
jgi:fibronectin type 3 domain-containing protein